MKFLILSEGDSIEEEIISSSIGAEINCDTRILSQDAAFINYLQYDCILITFVPSYLTAHYSLLESLLRLRKTIVSYNLDQNKFYFDYFSRKQSYMNLCKMGLRLVATDECFVRFLASINCEASIVGSRSRSRHSSPASIFNSNLLIVLEFRWGTASQEYIDYKLSFGYSNDDIIEASEYCSTYFEKFKLHFKEIIKHFKCRKVYIHIDSFDAESQFYSLIGEEPNEDVEIIWVNMRDIPGIVTIGANVLTNWHSSLFSGNVFNGYMFILSVLPVPAIKTPAFISGENMNIGFSEVDSGDFILKRVELNSTKVDVVRLCFEGFRGTLYNSPKANKSVLTPIYYSSFANLIRSQMRFLPYNIKSRVRLLASKILRRRLC
jgi:hypothetical protein